MQTIDMRSRRFGYFPKTFIWNGRERTVESVTACRTTGAKKMSHHLFDCVLENGDKVTLSQDLSNGNWSVK